MQHSRRAAHGQTLGEYELVRRLATGGMAEVYEARRSGPGGFSRKLAIKRILPQLANDSRLVDMFCDEARLHATLVHPNLVQVLDFGESNGELYMVMEFVDGISVADLIPAVAARRRTVELPVVVQIARDVLRALAYAHNACDEAGRPLGLVHRDVAPSNIMIGRSGEVKLTDFGIVRGFYIESRTAPGEVKGKIGYVSPEQAMGRSVDARSDLFSLAVVAAELLLARPLFPGRNELEILESLNAGDLCMLDIYGRHIPDELRAVLLRALAIDPNARFDTAQSFLVALERVARRLQLSPTPQGVASYLVDLGIFPVNSTFRPVAPRPSAQRPRLDSDLPPVHVPNFAEDSPDALAQQPADVDDDLRESGTMPKASLVAPALPAPVAEYQVRRESGTLLGALTLPTLLSHIATGRAGVATPVARDGGPMLPLAAVPELARPAQRPLYRFFDPEVQRRGGRTNVTRQALPKLLFGVALGRRTGLLSVRRGREEKRFFFVDGSPTMAASTDPAELLGARLVAERKVEPEQLERALGFASERGYRIGEALVARGLLRPSGLLSALTDQRLARLTSLAAWREGELSFVEGALCDELAMSPAHAPGRLVAQAVLGAYAVDELARLLEPTRGQALHQSPEFPSLLAELDLPSAEAHALRRAGDGLPFDALVRVLKSEGVSQVTPVLRAVFIGLMSGALVPR